VKTTSSSSDPNNVYEFVKQKKVFVSDNFSHQMLATSVEETEDMRRDFQRVNEHGIIEQVSGPCEGCQVNAEYFFMETILAFLAFSMQKTIYSSLMHFAQKNTEWIEGQGKTQQDAYDAAERVNLIKKEQWFEIIHKILSKNEYFKTHITSRKVIPAHTFCEENNTDPERLTYLDTTPYHLELTDLILLVDGLKVDTQEARPHDLARHGNNIAGRYFMSVTSDTTAAILCDGTTRNEGKDSWPEPLTDKGLHGLVARRIEPAPLDQREKLITENRTVLTRRSRMRSHLSNCANKYTTGKKKNDPELNSYLLKTIAQCGEYFDGDLDLQEIRLLELSCAVAFSDGKHSGKTRNKKYRQNAQSKGMLNDNTDISTSLSSSLPAFMSDLPDSLLPASKSAPAASKASAHDDDDDVPPPLQDTSDSESDSDNEGKRINIPSNIRVLLKPLDIKSIQQRPTTIDYCLHCSSPISNMLEHYYHHTCSQCYGNMYVCSPIHSPHDCFLYQVLFKSLDDLTPHDRFELLGEFQTNDGDWHCIYCNSNCSRGWKSKRPHGLIDSTLCTYVPGCVSLGTIACQLAINNSNSNHMKLSSYNFPPSDVFSTQPVISTTEIPTSQPAVIPTLISSDNSLFISRGGKEYPKSNDSTNIVDILNINKMGSHYEEKAGKEDDSNSNSNNEKTNQKTLDIKSYSITNNSLRQKTDLSNSTNRHITTNEEMIRQNIIRNYVNELRHHDDWQTRQALDNNKENIEPKTEHQKLKISKPNKTYPLKDITYNPQDSFIQKISENNPVYTLKRQETCKYDSIYPNIRLTDSELRTIINEREHSDSINRNAEYSQYHTRTPYDLIRQNSQNPSISGTHMGQQYGNSPSLHTGDEYENSYHTNIHKHGHFGLIGQNTNTPIIRHLQVTQNDTNISTQQTSTQENMNSPSVQTVQHGNQLSPGIYSVSSDNTVTFTPPQQISTANIPSNIPLLVQQTLSHVQNTYPEQTSGINPTIQLVDTTQQPQRVHIKQEKGIVSESAQLEKHGKTTETHITKTDDNPGEPSDSESSTSSSSEEDKRKKSHRKGKSSKKSKKGKKGRKHRKYYSSSSSDSENETSSSSEEEKISKPKTTLLSMLQDMTCDSEYADELVFLKTLFTRRSELPELRHSNSNYTPKLTDYFPESYKGNAKRLKRYLTRLLEYTAIKAHTHRERADLISEGPGLSEECTKDLEMAAKIPLPGLSDNYKDDKYSQKTRLLDLLLTYVILFYKDEPISALQDLKLKGPFLSGITRLYQVITSGNTQLPPKLIEESIARAILRSDSGDGMNLLQSFQSSLLLHKKLDPSYTKDENKHRRLIYNCCATLANEYLTLNNNSQIKEQFTRSQQQKVPRDPYPRSPHVQHREQNPRSPPSQHQEQYYRPTSSQYREQPNQSRQSPYRELYTQNRQQYHQESQPQQYNRRIRFEDTHLTDVIEQDDLVTEYANMVLENRNTNEAIPDAEQARLDKIMSFQRVFLAKPCRCCGSPHHAMLANNKGKDNRMYTEYQCPASQCERWADARQSPIKNLKYQINPEKFAQMCKLDSYKVMEAWKHYCDQGAGKFKKPAELSQLKSSIISFCKPTNGVRPQEHRTSSVTFKIKSRNQQGEIATTPTPRNCVPSTVIAIHSGDPYSKGTNLCGTLHLLAATKVEQATHDEIDNLHSEGINHLESLYTNEYRSLDDPDALRVRLMLPNGESFVVPYKEVQGRILPDTGSTTSLINEEFAQRRGLHIEEAPYEIILRDVNNGERIIQKRCYLRLTITTVTGREVTTVLPALVIPDLSHEILLGTKDLERYQVSVIPHLGQAKITIGYEELVFPMMDEVSITELQINLIALNANRKQC